MLFLYPARGKVAANRKHDSAFCVSCQVTESRNNLKNVPEPRTVPPEQDVLAAAQTAPCSSCSLTPWFCPAQPLFNDTEFGSSGLFKLVREPNPAFSVIPRLECHRIATPLFSPWDCHFKHLPFLRVPVLPSLCYLSGTHLPCVLCILPYTVIFTV